MALARDFPKARCVGLDLDAVSIERARRATAEAGLTERVKFVHGPLAGLDPGERYDLITCCDCVHEFAEPVETLGQIRERLADDGTLFVIEPRVADRLEDNCNPIATMFYGFSTFH